MPKKRANGEGNIRKRKDGRWEGRFTAGRDPETGKQIFKNVLGRTQAEVKDKLRKAQEAATPPTWPATPLKAKTALVKHPRRNCGKRQTFWIIS